LMVELSRTAEGKNSDALSGFLPVVYIQLSKIFLLKDFAWNSGRILSTETVLKCLDLFDNYMNVIVYVKR
jgi:hypothetical protein